MCLGKEERPLSQGLDCTACGEACERKLITLALPRTASGIALIRNVPAEICIYCGETRFSLHTTSRLMAMIRSTAPCEEVIMVPIYDLGRSGS